MHRDEEFHRIHVASADDVARILRDKELWTDPKKANEDAYIRLLINDRGDGSGEPSMLFLDDPDHAQLRKLLNAAFTPRAVEAMRPRARQIAEHLLDSVKEQEFDFMARVAGPYPTIVIAEMLGVDPAQRADFKRRSDAANDALLRAEVRKRRETASDDLIGAMVATEESGYSLTEDEIVQPCNLLLIAGNITTTDLIGNGLKALMDHRDQWEALKTDPELIKNAVEEMLRYDSPVTYSARIANADREMRGCPIHKGESICTALAAAKHDPELNAEPERFDITREGIRHHSFGGGRHFCLGAPLARLEAQELFAALIARLPNVKPGGEPPIYRAIPSFRGMREYWVQA
ncbi:MAG: cytochrome P450 [Erythrobacter sp.]|nr:cytochrome P450 [Erythrobacter sp.]